MLDVYFATRYLQLRDEVLDEGEDRSTAFTLEGLREEGSLSEEDFLVLSNGYSLLRSIDHNLRLIVGRSTRLPDPNHVTARDVAARMGSKALQNSRKPSWTRCLRSATLTIESFSIRRFSRYFFCCNLWIHTSSEYTSDASPDAPRASSLSTTAVA